MVSTRAPTSRSKHPETTDMDYISDNESEPSFPEYNSSSASNNVERANLLDFERNHERIRNDQRFIEKNNQIRDLTSNVKALANQINSANPNNERNTSPNREANTQNVVNHQVNIVVEVLSNNICTMRNFQISHRDAKLLSTQLTCFRYIHFQDNLFENKHWQIG